ncbi:AAA-type ATPase lid domain-containing protein [Anaeromicrobium sediminis]|uniref:Sigma-54 factor interaction domain-containing protein n=1 Tax=Anaeromicrobium sediminis TaxID=1478221 RepID=A0A267MJJ1_9FIRM|nr:hypothetical protein [Anaeromicrobium sediminis]PAB59739.1 hypothetical protein CCE28_09235 [Anaeromicrobium sediminis]
MEHDFSKEALDILCKYPWKGNVRELKHVIERLVVIVDVFIIDVEHLPKTLFSITPVLKKDETEFDFKNKNFKEYLEEYEEKLIKSAYSKYKTSVSVSKNIGISQSKAYRLIRRYIKE